MKCIGPVMTFWKSMTKRHTAFALEPKNIEFTGTTGYNKTCLATIQRSADLLAKLWLQLTIGPMTGANIGVVRFSDDVGRAIFEEVRLEIGSVVYDRLYPELEHANEELDVL